MVKVRGRVVQLAIAADSKSVVVPDLDMEKFDDCVLEIPVATGKKNISSQVRDSLFNAGGQVETAPTTTHR